MLYYYIIHNMEGKIYPSNVDYIKFATELKDLDRDNTTYQILVDARIASMGKYYGYPAVLSGNDVWVLCGTKMNLTVTENSTDVTKMTESEFKQVQFDVQEEEIL